MSAMWEAYALSRIPQTPQQTRLVHRRDIGDQRRYTRESSSKHWSMDFFGSLGSGGVKVAISFTADPSRPGVVPMDRHPSWKLRKNPFWRLKHPHGAQPVAPNVATIENTRTEKTDEMTGLTSSVSMDRDTKHNCYVYEAQEDVTGVVTLTLPPGKKIDHLGIKIEFIGRIDMGQGVHEGRPHYDFISLSKELAPPGTIFNSTTEIPFTFKNMDKVHESYSGRNVSVRYFVRLAMERKFLPPITKEEDVWVQICGEGPTENEPIKMEVGIEECLHIEFEYDRRHYHLQDVILGKIHFLLVRIKIKHMELAVIRRETSGEGVAAAAAAAASTSQPTASSAASNIFTETQTLVKYEIMDGAPVKGEVIPVRLSLRGIPADLTPTYTAVNNRFSVRYFLNLVLVDEEDRRYFKQQEIILWRKELG